MILTITLAVGGCLALLLALATYDQERLRRAWSYALTPEASRAVSRLRDQLANEQAAADLAYEAADQELVEGSYAEAVRLLGTGYTYLEQLTDDRIVLLRKVAAYSRVIGAIAPMPPLSPRAFRLADVSWPARLGVVAHHLLITSAERFQLRCALLRHGFRAVLRVLLRSRRTLERQPSEAGWTMTTAARSDFKTLSAETVESFQALVVSMVAEGRSEPAIQHR